MFVNIKPCKINTNIKVEVPGKRYKEVIENKDDSSAGGGKRSFCSLLGTVAVKASISYDFNSYVSFNKDFFLDGGVSIFLRPLKQKRLYKRENIATLNYEMQQMSVIPPALLCNSNN